MYGGATYNKRRTLLLVRSGEAGHAVEDLDTGVVVDVQRDVVIGSNHHISKLVPAYAYKQVTHTVAKAAWTAALRTLTATTGFRARMAASKGARKWFS